MTTTGNDKLNEATQKFLHIVKMNPVIAEQFISAMSDIDINDVGKLLEPSSSDGSEAEIFSSNMNLILRQTPPERWTVECNVLRFYFNDRSCIDVCSVISDYFKSVLKKKPL